MLSIDDKLVSLDVVEEHFVCDLNTCKGACCVYGDYGAPLEPDELKVLDEIYDSVKSYLTKEGLETIETDGKYVFNEETEKHATPLRADGACAYTIFENGIALCGIEKAWKDGAIAFQKPISCHLYPIRVTKHTHYEAVNYERWNICKAACKNGNKLKVPVHRFLKEAILRKYGEQFFNILDDYFVQNVLNKS